MHFGQDKLATSGDAISIGVVLASLLNFLPEIAALTSIIWTCIRIYETKTIQKYVLLVKKKWPL